MVEGQDTGSGVSKMETTAGVWQQSGFICSAAISSTPKIFAFMLLNVHGGEMAYKGGGQSGKGTRG